MVLSRCCPSDRRPVLMTEYHYIIIHACITMNDSCIGQWLVLEKMSDEVQPPQEPRRLRAKCTRRRCSESDVYWPQDGFCHDEETARRNRLCASSDTVLATDEYGDGYCKCQDGGKIPYVQVISAADHNSDQHSQSCYPVYSKGPCPRNHVIMPHGTRSVPTYNSQWL